MSHTPFTQRAFEDALRRMFEDSVPFNAVLGLRIASFDPDRTRLAFDMRPDLVGNYALGILHGGVVSAVLDVMAGFSIMVRLAHEKPEETLEAQLGRFRELGTIDLRIDYLRPGRGTRFLAAGSVLRLGSKVASVRMELENDAGELVATGAASFIVG